MPEASGGERSPEPQSLYARRAHPTATLQPRRHAPLRPPPRSRRPGRDLASSPAAARTHLAAAHDPHRHRAPTLATHPTVDPPNRTTPWRHPCSLRPQALSERSESGHGDAGPVECQELDGCRAVSLPPMALHPAGHGW